MQEIIETLTPAAATERLRAAGLRISPETLRDGIEQQRFPFGDLIRRQSGAPVCYIYKRQLDAWIAERAREQEPV